jgi:hypothetical protein
VRLELNQAFELPWRNIEVLRLFAEFCYIGFGLHFVSTLISVGSLYWAITVLWVCIILASCLHSLVIVLMAFNRDFVPVFGEYVGTLVHAGIAAVLMVWFMPLEAVADRPRGIHSNDRHE